VPVEVLPAPPPPPALSRPFSAPAPAPSPPFPSFTISFGGTSSDPVISASPTFLPPSAPSAAQHVDAITESKHLKWAAITQKFNQQAGTHEWDWEDGDYLPRYEYQPITCITDVWTEWASGLNGYIPVRDLTERWGARWRRNLPRRKTEGVRRKAIVDLVGELLKRPHWDVALVLRFLKDKYEPTFKPRAFSEHLTKNQRSGFHAVLQAAQSYPS
jgi:hypothetical protein